MSTNQKYLVPPVIYLESKDFTKSNNLKHFTDKTCVVMVQTNWCPACTAAKSHFQNFAATCDKSVACLTIDGGDDGGDEDSLKRIAIVSALKPAFEGFPDYLLFKNGKYVAGREIAGRTERHLNDFVSG